LQASKSGSKRRISVQTGLKAIVEEKPQLVFLDIELQAETAFEILEKLPDINFELIFTTAFDHLCP
jgi:two-component system LytT family response regulator